MFVFCAWRGQARGVIPPPHPLWDSGGVPHCAPGSAVPFPIFPFRVRRERFFALPFPNFPFRVRRERFFVIPFPNFPFRVRRERFFAIPFPNFPFRVRRERFFALPFPNFLFQVRRERFFAAIPFPNFPFRVRGERFFVTHFLPRPFFKVGVEVHMVAMCHRAVRPQGKRGDCPQVLHVAVIVTFHFTDCF